MYCLMYVVSDVIVLLHHHQTVAVLCLIWASHKVHRTQNFNFVSSPLDGSHVQTSVQTLSCFIFHSNHPYLQTCNLTQHFHVGSKKINKKKHGQRQHTLICKACVQAKWRWIFYVERKKCCNKRQKE